MDHAVAGLALSAMWFSYGLMQFPSGVYSDHNGRRITVVIAMVLFTASYFILGFAFSPIMFVMVLIMLGLGSGGFQTAAITMISELFPARRGRALGIQSSMGSLSGLMPLAAPLIASLIHWRGLFLIWGAISAVVIALFLNQTSGYQETQRSGSLAKSFAAGVTIFYERATLLMFAINIITAFTWLGFMSFYPTYLIESKGFSALEAGIAFGILSLGGLLLKPLMGTLADRYPKKPLIGTLVLIITLASGLLVRARSLAAVVAISIALSTLTSVFVVITAYLMGHWPEKDRGSKLGLYRTSTILIGSPTAALIGYLATAYDFDHAFLVLTALLALALFILVVDMARGGVRRLRAKKGS